MSSRHRARGLTLLEVVISAAVATILAAISYSLFATAASETSHSGRILTTIAGSHKLHEALVEAVRTAPYRTNVDLRWPASNPVGWPAGIPGNESPSLVKGAGFSSDELYFFTTIAVDADGDGLLSDAEAGLGARGVIGDYYRIHEITDPGGRALVRDRVAGGTGSVRVREVLARNVAPPGIVGTNDERRAFLIEKPAAASPRFFTFRLRLEYVQADMSGRAVYNSQRNFSVTARGD